MIKKDWREPCDYWTIPLENLKPINTRLLTELDSFEVKVDKSIELILNYKEQESEEEIIQYNKSNLMKIKSFLLSFRKNLLQEFDLNLEVPYILPGPNGSIDVHWDQKIISY